MSFCRGKGGQGFFSHSYRSIAYTTCKSKGSSLELVCFATLWSPPHSLQVNGLNDLLGPSPAVTSEDSVNNQCYKELSGGLWRTLEDIFWAALFQCPSASQPPFGVYSLQLSHATIYVVSWTWNLGIVQISLLMLHIQYVTSFSQLQISVTYQSYFQLQNSNPSLMTWGSPSKLWTVSSSYMYHSSAQCLPQFLRQFSWRTGNALQWRPHHLPCLLLSHAPEWWGCLWFFGWVRLSSYVRGTKSLSDSGVCFWILEYLYRLY